MTSPEFQVLQQITCSCKNTPDACTPRHPNLSDTPGQLVKAVQAFEHVHSDLTNLGLSQSSRGPQLLLSKVSARLRMMMHLNAHVFNQSGCCNIDESDIGTIRVRHAQNRKCSHSRSQETPIMCEVGCFVTSATLKSLPVYTKCCPTKCEVRSRTQAFGAGVKHVEPRLPSLVRLGSRTTQVGECMLVNTQGYSF